MAEDIGFLDRLRSISLSLMKDDLQKAPPRNSDDENKPKERDLTKITPIDPDACTISASSIKKHGSVLGVLEACEQDEQERQELAWEEKAAHKSAKTEDPWDKKHCDEFNQVARDDQTKPATEMACNLTSSLQARIDSGFNM